jgi:DnaJ-class molecular chaperone
MATVKQIRCHCAGKTDCKLCGGTGKYSYEPGERGYIPFRCPQCDGAKTVLLDGDERKPCLTCNGEGIIDPANPPPAGLLDVLTKILFGA